MSTRIPFTERKINDSRILRIIHISLVCKIYQATQITISWYFLFPKYPAPVFHHVKYRKALQRKPIQKKVIQFVDPPLTTPYIVIETVNKSSFEIVQCANINCFKVRYHFYYFKIIIVFSICYMAYTFIIFQTKI